MVKRTIVDVIQERYKSNENGIFYCDDPGYWSNLDEKENEDFLEDLKKSPSAREALIRRYPQYYDVVFSPKREAGLELLGLRGEEVCADYGCMWGALTIPLAKRTRFVLGIDQTLHSLIFLSRRIEDEKLCNINLLCENLNGMPIIDEMFDVAVVNGVLEWIPEKGKIELKRYFGKKIMGDEYSYGPETMQVNFLKNVYANLNKMGRLYLAIENRFDFRMFLGVKDPHADLMFTSILPRKIANLISMRELGRPYINWLYSFFGLKKILRHAGFGTINLYSCFPNYRFPQFISPYGLGLDGFHSTISLSGEDGKIKLRRVGGMIVELLLFKYLKADFFAPSIIAIATKD